MTQHSGLDEGRWARFDLDQQILMIGNEMNRLVAHTRAGRTESIRLGYERVLRLVDLTIGLSIRPTLRKELLRWRGLVAGLFLAEGADPALHEAVFRILLQLRPLPSRQIPHLLGTVRRVGAPRN